MGAGYTVEGQKTGEEKFGGLQIEITPAYRSALKIWFRATELQSKMFDYNGSLNELTSPAANGLRAGDKLRAYPQPTRAVPLTISDLISELTFTDTSLHVKYAPKSVNEH